MGTLNPANPWLWISLLLFAVFLVIASYNAFVVCADLRGKRTESGIPFLGGLFGVIALRIWPMDLHPTLCLLPLVLDYGALPGSLLGLWRIFRGS